MGTGTGIDTGTDTDTDTDTDISTSTSTSTFTNTGPSASHGLNACAHASTSGAWPSKASIASSSASGGAMV